MQSHELELGLVTVEIPGTQVTGVTRITLPSAQDSDCVEQHIIPVSSFEHDYVIPRNIALEETCTNLKTKIQYLEEVIEQYSVKRFCLERFSNCDQLIKFYTGFPNYRTIKNFFLSIESYIPKMVIWSQQERPSDSLKTFGANIPPIDQLFMFLYKLRLRSFDQELADRFLVSAVTVSRIIITWANFLYFILGSQPLWPSKQNVQQFRPKCFQDAYPKTRVIIDSIEIAVQNPSRLTLNSELYSSSQSKATVKGLIGLSPGGAVCFVSNLYTGSISDNSLVLNSGILDLLEEGDEVMARKDFQISDVIKEKKCTLVMPNIASSDSMLIHQAVNSKNIADVQVHLDKAIQRLKKFRLFESKYPLNMLGSVNQLWTVTCLITNFQHSLTVSSAED